MTRAAALVAAGLLVASAARAGGIERAADVLQLALPAAALGVTLGHGDTEGSGQLLRSGGATLAVTWALKLGIDAERPNGGSRSFPSGHSAAAFAGASFLARRYGWRIGLPALGAASFVAWSRVHTDDHHVEDVIAAAALAIASAAAIATPLPDGLSVGPTFVSDGIGIGVGGRW